MLKLKKPVVAVGLMVVLGLSSYHVIQISSENSQLESTEDGVSSGKSKKKNIFGFVQDSFQDSADGQNPSVAAVPFETELTNAFNLMSAGNNAAAEEILTAIVEQDPENQEALSLLVTVYGSSELDREKGVECLEKLILIDQNNAAYFWNYENVIKDLGHYERAVSFLKSSNVEANYSSRTTLALIHWAAGDLQQAAFEMKASTELDNPKKAENLEKLGQIYNQMGDKQGAQESFALALASYKEHNQNLVNVKDRKSATAAAYLFVQASLENGNYDGARETLGRLLDKDPNDSTLKGYSKRLEVESGVAL